MAVAVGVPPSVPSPGLVAQGQRHRAVEARIEVAEPVLGGDGQAEAGAGGHARLRLAPSPRAAWPARRA